MSNNLKPVPEVGKLYHFFDDGKTSPSRHYICKCERVITPGEAKNIMFRLPLYIDGCAEDDIIVDTSLYDHWHNNEMPCHDWLYSEETDYFVECSCPNYDEHNLWFVRTKDGGWFSMDIQSSWQAGRLDVDGNIFDGIIQNINDNPDWYDVEEIIKAYNEEKYEKKIKS